MKAFVPLKHPIQHLIQPSLHLHFISPTPPPPPHPSLSIQYSVFFSEDIASEQGAGAEILQGTSLRMPKIPDYESFRRIIDKVLYCAFYSSSSFAPLLMVTLILPCILCLIICSTLSAPLPTPLLFLPHISCLHLFSFFAIAAARH